MALGSDLALRARRPRARSNTKTEVVRRANRTNYSVHLSRVQLTSRNPRSLSDHRVAGLEICPRWLPDQLMRRTFMAFLLSHQGVN